MSGPRGRRADGPSPARRAAARVLERVEQDRAFANIVLDHEISRRRLDARDAALATELALGTLRWQRYLDWILEPHSRRRLGRLDPGPRALLRLTAYQLVFLDRVPAFAAVDDAVSLARPLGPGVAAYTNAVLRSLARRGPREREPRAPADPAEALGVRLAYPTWLAARWLDRWGAAEATELMQALNERPPLTLRVNTRRLSREGLARRLADEDGIASRPTALAPEGLLVEGGGQPGVWRAFADGACTVQDEAAMLIAHLVAPRPGDTVVDACAAPGGGKRASRRPDGRPRSGHRARPQP